MRLVAVGAISLDNGPVTADGCGRIAGHTFMALATDSIEFAGKQAGIIGGMGLVAGAALG